MLRVNLSVAIVAMIVPVQKNESVQACENYANQSHSNSTQVYSKQRKRDDCLSFQF